MALINGNEYDHIDFTKNGVTTRHPFKDTVSRQMSSDLVKVQDEEPTSEGTKIWIKPSGDSEVQVPTYEEFEALSDRVDDINTMSVHICTAQEYNSETGVPTVSNPDAKTFYLVPGGDAPNLYIEWIFTNDRWEQFGSATIDLSNYATKNEIPDVPVKGVHVNDESILDANGVAKIPNAGYGRYGVMRLHINPGNDGLRVQDGNIGIYPAFNNDMKLGAQNGRPITPKTQDASTFYGLAKAAGHDEKDSVLPTGQYTEEAKDAINEMLGVEDRASAVIENTASGSVASFTDGAKDRPVDKLTVKIEPQQDLHGYDHPWPAGGGVNKFNPSFDAFTARGLYAGQLIGTGNGEFVTLTVFDKDTSVDMSGVYFGLSKNGINAQEGLIWISNGASILNSHTVTRTDMPYVTVFPKNEETFNKIIARFDVIAGISETAYTSFSPYSNICPITGYTGAQIIRNAGNYATMDSVMEGYILNSSGATYAETGMITTDYMPVSQGDEINLYFVSKQAARSRRVIGYNEDKTYNSTLFESTWTTVDTTIDRTYTIQSGIAFVRASYYSGDVNKSLVNKTYESVYPISWQTEAGTVYGGELTINVDGSGSLVVDRASVDLGTLTWTYATSGAYPYFESSKIAKAKRNGECVCSTFEGIAAQSGQYWYTDSHPNEIGFNSSGGSAYVRVQDSRYTDAATFKTAMDGVQLVYELATPQTYTLTASEIHTLLGQNHIWSDTGDVEVRYRANTKLYIDTNQPEVPVKDVRVNGSSVLQDGVADVPIAGTNKLGAVMIRNSDVDGLTIDTNGTIHTYPATSVNVKMANNGHRPLVSTFIDSVSFFGLAKSAGDTTQSASSNAVGVYTESAKSAIHEMLNGSVSVSGTTPTINALPGVRYICGEVSTITVTVPASGIVDIVFTSGNTPAVLTINGTVRWANGFDPTSLDTDTTYEINIADGLGVAGAWT